MGLDTGLLLIFVVLKLTGVIAWSWWFVVSPIFFGLVLRFLLLSYMEIVKAGRRK
jgi:hypothetical protein